jgi:hypothetical protein
VPIGVTVFTFTDSNIIPCWKGVIGPKFHTNESVVILVAAGELEIKVTSLSGKKMTVGFNVVVPIFS